MGRIGRSYPRFPPATTEQHRARRRRISRSQFTGAIVGVLGALSLIGFLLTR